MTRTVDPKVSAPAQAVARARVVKVARLAAYPGQGRAALGEWKRVVKVWVLLKEQGEGSNVLAVYADRADLDVRIERIRKANAQYPMQTLGESWWKVGPKDDEGFFGHKPVYLRAVEAPYRSSLLVASEAAT